MNVVFYRSLSSWVYMRQGIFTSWTAVFHPNRLNETAVNGETQFSRISLRYDEGTKPSFGIFTISLFFNLSSVILFHKWISKNEGPQSPKKWNKDLMENSGSFE